MAESLFLRVSAITHTGYVKEANEDTVGVADWVRNASMASVVSIVCRTDEPRVCVVADGLGGHAAGQIASNIVVRELMQASSKLLDSATLGEALGQINQITFDAMSASDSLLGMGSTVVGVVALGGDAIIFNAGDSRAYVSSGDFLQLISTDDTRHTHSVDTSERTGQHGHSITQCIGGAASFQALMPHVAERKLEPGSRILLCSDGLTDMLDQDAIESYLEADPSATVRNLLHAALEAGGADNVSIIVVDVAE